MKYYELIDITCKPHDHVEVDIQEREMGDVLYVYYNGVTLLRLCRIKNGVMRPSAQFANVD